jgi:tetratricopeptide (TPR) repeat protein
MAADDFARRIEELLGAALDLEPAQRETFLVRQCAADPALLAEVRSLLKHQQRAHDEGLLARPAPTTPPAGRDALQSTDASVASDRAADLPAHVGRYPILGLIGQGGMGVVYRALDASLQRPLAVKVLLAEHADDDELTQRFLKEAQIMGQLQHPGVAPIHELGQLSDGRPFFSMKQIQGETLADLLQQRSSPGDALATYLGIFGQVCQTLAYAHARHIIHRDLKPANIMVGAFGEVQVMDWGLAKVLSGTETEDSLAPAPGQRSAVAAVPLAGGTLPGTVLGTPAYMPPEQARGEVERIDQRSDVFGLGAILCEILSGAPPYSGSNALELLTRAATADLRETLARLEQCGADPELVALCRRCLAPEPDQRPRHGGAVADVLGQYQAQVQQRLRQAEIARAQAQVKAAEERKRRRVSVALLLLALGFVVAASGASVWYVRDQAERAEEARRRETEEQGRERETSVRHHYVNQQVSAALDEAVRLDREINDHLADPVKTAVFLSNPQQQWEARLDRADRAWQQASALAGSGREGLDLAVTRRLADVAAQLQVARDDWKRAKRLDDVRLSVLSLPDGKVDPARIAAKTQTDFQQAFAGLGLDVARQTAEDIAARVTASRLRYVLVAALDQWAAYTQANDPRQLLLLQAARLADPDPWRNQARDSEIRKDPSRLKQLAAEVQPARHSPHVLMLFTFVLDKADSAALFRRALIDHPRDFWLHYWRGVLVEDPQETIACFQAALAVRPESEAVWSDLGVVLQGQGDLDGAMAAYRKAIALNDKHAVAHNNLGVALEARNDWDGAVAAYRKAVALDPHYAAAQGNLGNALRHLGDLDGAIAACRKAIDLDLKDASTYTELGLALAAKGDRDGAIVAFHTALAANPKDAKTCSNLGAGLAGVGDLDGAITAFLKAIALDPKNAGAHYNLALARNSKGDLDGAIAALRQAVGCNPKFGDAYYNLGNLLHNKKDLDGAIAAYRQALACNGKDASAYYNLGNVLQDKGDLDGAIVAYRQATDCDPKKGSAYKNLGFALVARGDMKGANAAFRKAIDCNPKDGDAHASLATVLRFSGALEEAVAEFRQAVALKPDHPGFQYALRSTELWLTWDKRMPELLAGTAKPSSPADAVEVAELCRQSFKKHYAVSLKLYREAFALDKPLEVRHRFDAAEVALLLAAGKDAAVNVASEEAGNLRQQAHQWLTAELEVVRKDALSDQPAARNKARKLLGQWAGNANLASIRDAASLDRLPAEERDAWRQFWGEVDRLLGMLAPSPRVRGYGSNSPARPASRPCRFLLTIGKVLRFLPSSVTPP